MLDAQKLFRRSGKKPVTQRALLRANKQAFLQHGQVDWHLPKSQESRNSYDLLSGMTAGIVVIRLSDHQDQESPHHDHPLQDSEYQDNLDVMTAPPQLKKPPFYAVVLFNDDYTPMEFVIEILQVYFDLDLDRATEVMLTVHYRGRGVAGIYPRDIAETKAQQVNNYARSQGHPLLCQIEPQPE